MFQVVSILSIFFIVVSILTFCLKTHPSLRIPIVRNVSVTVSSSKFASAIPSRPPQLLSVTTSTQFTSQERFGCDVIGYDKSSPASGANCTSGSSRRRDARRTPMSKSSSNSHSKDVGLMTSSSRGAPYRGGGTPWLLQLRSTEPHLVFFYIECICNAWFSVELLVRLAVAPSRLTFVLTPVNIIELIASASFYLDFLMTYLKRDSDVLEFFRYV